MMADNVDAGAGRAFDFGTASRHSQDDRSHPPLSRSNVSEITTDGVEDNDHCRQGIRVVREYRMNAGLRLVSSCLEPARP
jgi:hypothetical protein